MARRQCKRGYTKAGTCRKARKRRICRTVLAGPTKTCVRYSHTGKRGMRCLKVAQSPGCPPYRGQKGGSAACVARSRSRSPQLVMHRGQLRLTS